MRRTKADAEKTCETILATAEQLFLRHGVAHTSLEQVARASGVTRGAVYRYFQNKSHPLNELLNQARPRPEQIAERLRPGISPRLAARLLHATLVGMLSDRLRDPGLFRPRHR